MHLRRVIAAAALAAALAAGGAASAAPQPKKIWVGTLSLTYSRIFETPVAYGIATERDVRTLTIVNRKDGTATVTGKVESSFRYPCANGTFSGRTEAWAPVGKVQPIRVGFAGNRYQLDYPNPGEQVTIEELTCTELTKRVAPVWAMNVGFQLYGKASPDATRITGEWKQRPDCSGTCKVFEWRGRWDLRLVTVPSGAGGGSGGTGGGGSGGGGSAGGSGRAGAGCEARVRNGTARDDVLRGSAAAELLRGLAGDDRVLGLAGADCLRGGAGDDTLLGGPGRDLLIGEAGEDGLDGGAGDDELRARDGVAETVRCGSGRDLALVDAADRVVGCETVRR